MTQEDSKRDLQPNRKSSLTLLQLMALLAVLGVILAWLATYFWGQ